MKTIVAVSLLSLTLSGCASMRDYVMPSPPEGSAETKLTQENDLRFAAEQKPIAAWWREFNDAHLTELVEQSLKTNIDVRIAFANLREARALSRSVNSDQYPTIDANGGYTRNLNSNETTNRPINRVDNTYQAGFDASWELDLFGRVSSRIAMQQALEQAEYAQLHQIYVTVTAEVAKTYFELRGAQYRLSIASRNAGNQAATYQLTQTLQTAGGASALDVSRAQTQLSLTQASIPPLQAEVNAAINRLSVLTGQVPNALRDRLSQTQLLPSLPVTIAVGDTAELIRRRPDINVAERQLAATVSNYNLAVAELFPSVSISGSLGFIATNLSSFGTSALAGAIGPSLSWRLFDRDRLNAEIDQSDARSVAALANYEKTVLMALEETQTALSDFTHEEQRRLHLQQAAASAKQSAIFAKERFDHGYDNFLDVLVAESTLLEAEDALANSEIASGLDLISIYKALGGGWQVASE